MAEQSETEPTFEQALEQLQQTVRKLESGDLPLEEALKSFETGVRLTRLCQQHLATADQRIEQLVKASADGQVETTPFPYNRS